MTLRLLHPFMPFVTEAVWQRLPRSTVGPTSLMVCSWPEPGGPRDQEAEAWFGRMCTLVTAVRNTRAEHDISPKERLPLACWCDDSAFASALREESGALAWLARADAARVEVNAFNGRGQVDTGVVRTVVAEGLEVDTPVPETVVDTGKEVQRLTKQLDWITGQLASTEKKITPAFLEKANPVAKEKILQKKEELSQQKTAVAQQLEELGAPARREVLVGAALCAWLSRPLSAQANVGEGDVLPQGAKQEDRIRKGLDAWKKLAVKLKTMEEISDDEWSNTQGFLRRLYSLNDDMGYLAKGFTKDKKRTAEQLITTFKKRVKATDKPTKAHDLDTFMANHSEITEYINNFMDMLSDAAPELEFEEEDVMIS